MSASERREIIREFLAEIQPHMQKLEEKLLRARTSFREGIEIVPQDMETMFHAVHTIKGTASLIGLGKIVSMAHQLGTLFKNVYEYNLGLTAESVELSWAALEALKALMRDLEEKNEEVTDVEEILARLAKFLGAQIPLSSDTQKKDGKEKTRPKVSSSSSSDIDEKYLEVYLDDTEQNIGRFNDDLVALEKDPSDTDLINSLFRIMHTIKGSSGMVNVVDVQEVAHAMENILAIVREKREALPDMFSLLLQGIDVINSRVLSLRRKGKVPIDIAPVVQALKAYVEGLTGGEKDKASQEVRSVSAERINLLEKAVQLQAGRRTLIQAVDHKNKVYQITVSVEESASLKSMKALLVEEHLKNKGVVVLMSPRPELIDDSVKGALLIDILFCTVLQEKEILPLLSVGQVNITSIEQIATERIKELLEEQFKIPSSGGMDHETKGDESTSSTSAPQGQARGTSPLTQTAVIRIEAHKLDTLMNLSGELVTVRAQFERLVALLGEKILSQRDFMRSAAHIKSNFVTLTKDMRSLTASEDSPGLRRILKQADDLNIHFDHLEQHISQSYLGGEIHSIDETTGILGKVASDIQAAVMQARMVPIKGVFSRFNRIVRDIAKDLGKDIHLVLDGEETELDKNLVDSLGEPLTHMVRNAIDHGIEDVATRQKLKKAPRGTILLKAFHEGNNVCVEVKDDGKGLDPEVLANSAVKKKLIAEEQAKRLTDREKLDLMFLPGFSTAAQVTGLSGRGVGMDVVRNMIVAINGIVDIQSEIGQGTTFILKIPLTLAIIQALLIVVDGEIYALPLEAVTEIIKVADNMIYSIDGNATVKLRDEVMSLIELKDVIHLRGTRQQSQTFKRVVVISDGNSQVGIVVDKLIGESEIVIKALSHHFFNVKGISGVTILGDGQISLILDPKLIIMESR